MDMEVVTAAVTTHAKAKAKVDGRVIIIEEIIIRAATEITKDLGILVKEEVVLKIEIIVVTVEIEVGTQIAISAGMETEEEGVGIDSIQHHETPKLLKTLNTNSSFSVKPKSNRQEFSLISTTKYPWK